MDAVSRRRQGAFALQLDRRLFVEPPPPESASTASTASPGRGHIDPRRAMTRA